MTSRKETWEPKSAPAADPEQALSDDLPFPPVSTPAIAASGDASTSTDCEELSFDEIFGVFLDLELDDVFRTKRFSLREACPDVLEFMKSQVRFPVSQRKLMAEVFEEVIERPVRVRDNEEFYEAFLDIVEDDPGQIATFLMAAAPAFRKKTPPRGKFFPALSQEFAPVKLSVKTYHNTDAILESFDRDGVSGLSTSDLTGIFFTYGLLCGLERFEAIDAYLDEIEWEQPGEANGATADSTDPEDEIQAGRTDVSEPVRASENVQFGIERERIALAEELSQIADGIRGSPDTYLIDEARSTVERLQDWQERYKTGVIAREFCARLKAVLGIDVVIPDTASKRLKEIEELVGEAESLVARREAALKQTAEIKVRVNAALEADDWAAVENGTTEVLGLNDQIGKSDVAIAAVKEKIRKWLEAAACSLTDENAGPEGQPPGEEVPEDDGAPARAGIDVPGNRADEPTEAETETDCDEHEEELEPEDPAQTDGEQIAQVDVSRGKKRGIRPSSAPDDTHDPAMKEVFAGLLYGNHLAVAARLARALDRTDQVPALPTRSIELAAGSRIPFESYDPSTLAFQAEIIPAEQDAADDPNANAILFGALLRPAILQPSTIARETLGRLSLGPFGASVGDLAQAIATLDFSFHPSVDDLARLSGRSGTARRPRVERALIEWADTTIMRQGPCQPSTALIHKLAKPNGEFGTVVNAIRAGQTKRAERSARDVISRFETPELINARIAEINPRIGTQSKGRFRTNTMTYIYRRISEGRNLLIRWVDSVDEERRKVTDDASTQKRIVLQLDSRARKTVTNLKSLARTGDILQSATCAWVLGQVEEFRSLLKGQLPETWVDMEAARSDELDLLPLRSAHVAEHNESVAGDAAVIDYLFHQSVPTVEKAIARHGENGAFRVAARLLSRVGETDAKEALVKQITKSRTEQIDHTLDRITEQVRALRDVGKFDLRRPEQIQREVSRLEIIRENLQAERNIGLDALATSVMSDLPADIDEIVCLLETTDALVDDVRADIRSDQHQRLKAAREAKPHLSGEIDELIVGLQDIPLDYVEDQIAHIRDDRAIGQIVNTSTGPFEAFFPAFVKAAEEADWPDDIEAYASALEKDVRMAVPPDRLDAARDLLRDWYALETAATKGRSTTGPLKTLLQSLAFQAVAPRKGNQLQGKKARVHVVSMKVPPTTTRFLPPEFGTKSNDHFEVVIMHHSVLMEQVLPSLKTDVPTFIIVTGRLSVDRRRDTAHRLRRQGVMALLIDETLLAFIASQKEDRLEVLFDCGLPFGRIEPYITDAGQLPPEMFFGRKQEIAKIIGRDSEGILVYGGRQLGKSALLAQVQQLHNEPGEGRVIIREDVKSLGTSAREADEIWKIMSENLRPHGVVGPKSASRDAVVADIKRWIMDRPNRQVLCLLDETDNFLAFEAKNDFPNLMHIKGLMENTSRAFKVVFAGLHHVQRMYKSSNSPLAHFGSAICVGPLNRTHDDREAAYRLVVEPMRAAGFRFEDDSVPDEILSFVNHYPSLVQVYSKELLAHLATRKSADENGPLWVVPRSTLFEGKGFENIETGIRRKFGYTLDLDPRYKLIAYVLGFLKWQGKDADVLHDGLGTRAILTATEEYWPEQFEPIPLSDMQIILDEMFELGILGKIEHDHSPPTYCLRTRQVANMLGTEDEITEELIALQDVEPPLDYDPSTNRRVMRQTGGLGKAKDARHFSPLTDGQLRHLLHDEDVPGVRLVTGTRILGLRNVGPAIQNYARTLAPKPGGREIIVEVAKNVNEFAASLRKEPKRRIQIKVVVYAPLSNHNNGIRQLLNFSEGLASVKAGSVRPILVLNAEQPNLREVAIGREALALRPWGGEMLRTYLNLIEEQPLDRRDLRDAILVRTGGIPDEVVRVLSNIRGKENPSAAIKVLDAVSLKKIGVRDKGLREATVILADIVALTKSDEEVDHVQIYDLANDEIGRKVGCDLETIGSDLLALGILDQFEPRERKFRISRLGRLLAKRLSEGQEEVSASN